MKNVLITGASGFVGSHLIDHLLATTDSHIFGTYRGEKPQGEGARLQFIQVDLQDRKAVDALLTKSHPDELYHLAAQSSVPQSFKDPIATFHANIDAQINVLESLKDNKLTQTKVLLVTSGEVYGYIKPEDLPVDEQTPHRPANPYAVSKLTQDYLGLQYHISYNLPIVRVRPFNHVGPRQAPVFVVSDFAKQIAEIEKGTHEPIMRLGNMEAKRDFTDVRDMVRLYPMLLEKGQAGEAYNAGSGTSRSIQEILDMLLSFTDLTVTVESDPAKMRPSDLPEIVADAKRAKELTRWEPEISLEQTLQDVLDYWRKIV